ncbi:hypothetical protein [Streptomyces albireticuli]|uniref:hypothetical protein n=1 Tax=Streptomyces albireticuli TaxID=1940 RepID=UPI00368B99AA
MPALTAARPGPPRRLGVPEAVVLIVVIVLAALLAAHGGTATRAPAILGLLCGAGLAGALVLRCSTGTAPGRLLRSAGVLAGAAQG